jgi:hypothetical protein
MLYLRYPHLPPETLALEGAYLQLVTIPRGEPDPDYELQMFFPLLDGDNQQALAVMSMPELRLDPRVRTGEGSPDVRPVVRPSRLSRMPRSAREARQPYLEDPRFAGEIEGGKLTIDLALQRIAAQTQAPLAVGSRLRTRKLKLAPPRVPIRKLLAQIEELTAGAWVSSGEALVLQPHLEVEGLAELLPTKRPRWLAWAGQDVLDRLTERQCERLRAGAKLTPVEFTSEQRCSLQWLTLIAFAGDPDISRDALSLQGLQLSAERPTQAKAPWQVQFHGPTREPGSALLAQVEAKL